MEYRPLGVSGVKVSPLCLGSMMFGGATDEQTARRIVDRAREQGVNFVDTADGYNGGKAEEIVGRAISEHRSWWVLATKCANPTGQGPNARGLSRRHVFDAVEALTEVVTSREYEAERFSAKRRANRSMSTIFSRT